MNCVTCGNEIPAARLRAIPNAVQCVGCVQANGDPKVAGRMIWSGKHAPEIEIGTRFAAQKNTRRGYGPGIQFESTETAAAELLHERPMKRSDGRR